MTRKGVWNIQDVRDKYTESLWENPFKLYTWGSNGKGYLMRNNTNPGSSTSPHHVPGTIWKAVATGKDQIFAAVRSDGTLWMGGGNEKGTLGINEGNDDVRRSSPTQIPGTTWTSEYTIGNGYALAVKSDGTLWVWGKNNEGQLGMGNQTQYLSPVQVPGTTWAKVGASNISSVATRTDGTMWTFGEAKAGSLGHNSSGEKVSSPKQVGTDTNWQLNRHSLAISQITAIGLQQTLTPSQL